MKTILLLLSIFFVLQATYGEKRKSASMYSSFQEGDWIDIETTNLCPIQSSNPFYLWDKDRDKLNVTFRIKVIKKTKGNIQLSVKLKHVYFSQYIKQFNYSNYFDSYYSADSLPEISFKYTSFPSGESISYIPGDSIVQFKSTIISGGIKNPSRYYHPTTELQKIRIMPILAIRELEKVLRDGTSSTGRIIGSSSPLAPNSRITYFPEESIPEGNEVFLKIGDQKIKLQRQKYNRYLAEYHLFSPQEATLDNNIKLHLTPGDSIRITQTKDSLLFAGKSAETFRFWQEIKEKTRSFLGYRGAYDYWQGLEVNLEKINTEKRIYEDLLKKYENYLLPYWKEHVIRTLKYWEIKYRMDLYLAYSQFRENDSLADKYEIPWNQPPFNEVSPLLDHLYHPQCYPEFLETYFSYKIRQLSEENLTNKFYQETGTQTATTYNLQKQMFSGYPQSYLLYKNIEYRIENYHLSRVQKEYEDFCQICNDSILLQNITQKWQHYRELEPGKNIQDLGLHLSDTLLFKKKGNDYILLLITNHIQEPSDQKTDKRIEQILEELKLKDRTALYYFYPTMSNRNKSLYDKPEYHFINDSLVFRDMDKLQLPLSTLLILSNNGTILSREVQKSEEKIDLLKNVLEEDIRYRMSQKQLNRSELLGILITLLTVTAIVSIIVFVRFRRIKLSRKFTELKLKAIRSQMNPHFTFNALGSIQSLIVQGKNDLANRYLTNFAQLLRSVLSTSEKNLVTLSDEINQLRLYLQLEQLRTPFDFNITTDPSVNTDNEEIPGMLLQPIVENAVIHGIVPQGGGQIDIHFYQKNSILYCEIADTGKGPGFTGANPNKSKRFGVRATEERLQLVNKEYHSQIGMVMKDRQQEENTNGCRVIISIPV